MSSVATGANAGSLLVHGTTVAVGAVGLLLRGSSGAGKSDLALRFLADDGRWPFAGIPRLLVADDQTKLSLRDGQLFASAPDRIRGKLEVRGLGIIDVAASNAVPLRLVVDLVKQPDIERMPEISVSNEFFGIAVPCRKLQPFEASAALKLALMLTSF